MKEIRDFVSCSDDFKAVARNPAPRGLWCLKENRMETGRIPVLLWLSFQGQGGLVLHDETLFLLLT